MDKKVKNKLVAGLLTIVTTISSYAAVKLFVSESKRRASFEEMKPISQISQEMEALGYEYEYVKTNDKGEPLRLAFKDNEPVIVKKDDSLNDNVSKAMDDVCDYLNKVFSTINENYSFKIVDSDYKTNLNETVVSVRQKDINRGEVTGTNSSSALARKFGSPVTLASQITFDDSVVDYDMAFNVGLHEMSHSLGFADTYNKGEFKDSFNDSIMFSVLDSHNIYSPLDYATLYFMYSDGYKTNDLNGCVKLAKEAIDDYKCHYYEHKLFEVLPGQYEDTYMDKKENLRFTDHHDDRYVNGESKDVDYSIVVNGEDYKITARDASDHSLIEEASGKVIRGDHLFVLENVEFKNIGLWDKAIGARNGVNLYLLKDKDGKYKFMDGYNYRDLFTTHSENLNMYNSDR